MSTQPIHHFDLQKMKEDRHSQIINFIEKHEEVY